MFDFADQIVMVTGAAGNLGTAVCGVFRRAGAQMVLVDRDMQRIAERHPELADDPEHWLALGVDLTDAAAVTEMVETAVSRLGRIDVLINAAGGYRAGTPLHETSAQTWDFLMDLNGRSVFNTSRAVLPVMLRQGRGKIINVAARSGLEGSANEAAYAAAKATVLRLTESMAAEVRAAGINVNCVIPGTLDTPANRQASPDANYAGWVTPESLASVIQFLASDLARDVNGAALPVYGLT